MFLISRAQHVSRADSKVPNSVTENYKSPEGDALVSPKETDASEDAQTLALRAPLWKFRLLHSLSFLQTLFTSIKCKARPKSCLDSPNIPKFRWGMYTNHNAINLDIIPGKEYKHAFKKRNITESRR